MSVDVGLDVRRVGPEAAADVLAVVQAAFGARPPLDPPADALGDDLASITRLLGGRGGLFATLDGVPAGCLVLHAVPDGMTPEGTPRVCVRETTMPSPSTQDTVVVCFGSAPARGSGVRSPARMPAAHSSA